MKTKYLFILLLFLVFSACTEEEVNWEKYYATAMLNGALWEDWPHSVADYVVSKNNKLSFRLIKFHYEDDSKFFKELITFSNIDFSYDTIQLKFLMPGNRVDSIPTVRYYIKDHDATEKTYDLLETDTFDNWLIVEKVGKHEFRGRFQIAVKKSQQSPTNSSYRPDTLYFTEGEFLARGY